MGTCKYCGENAGLFRSVHADCEKKHVEGLEAITAEVAKSFSEGTDPGTLDAGLAQLKKDSFIDEGQFTECVLAAFDRAVDNVLEDTILTRDEEEKLNQLRDHFQIDKALLESRDSWQKLVKAAVLRDISEGNISGSRLKIEGTVPFLLQKGETLIWAFNHVGGYEQRTRTVYEGRSSGFSVRIVTGVYYRTGAFRGNPVQVNEMNPIGTGLLGVTNKNIYFASASKSLRIPLAKIITLIPYEDGIGLQKDGQTAKPVTFKDLDGWFIYNLVTALAHM